MTISGKYCEENLDLLIALLQSKGLPGRQSLVIGFSDLFKQQVMQVDPRKSELFDLLFDPVYEVRHAAIVGIGHLFAKDMIKVKGELVDFAIIHLQG